MKRASTLVAAILVVLLAWANVGVAGQRDRLREKVRALVQRVVALEQETLVISNTSIQDYQVESSSCPDGAPAIWRFPADDTGKPGPAVLSC